MSTHRLLSAVVLATGLLLAAGCAESQTEPVLAGTPSFDEVAAPAPLVSVAFAGWQSVFWPFTGTSLAGTVSDPINVVFPNRDARDIRASLMFLNGDRTAFGMPNAPPFNCVWKDAVGDAQLGYSEEGGWTGSAIQLECGDYAPMRFHVRLFPAGGSTIANAHFEVIVPGTNQHEVLSWEVAEQLVKVDFLRSGLLNPAAPLGLTQAINPMPTFKTINPLIYNGLPLPLRGLIGGPLTNVGAPVPIPSDGRATIVNMAAAVEAEKTIVRREIVINFNQTIPKPFCSTGPFDYVRVQGPVTVDQTILVNPNGDLRSRFHAHGTLEVTPINPLNGAILGQTYKAVINEQQRNVITDERTLVTALRLQKLISADDGILGMLTMHLEVGTDSPRSTVEMRCE